ncbi:hypothetical protein ACVWXS_003016 [Lysinibacillus sp. TE18511]
MIIKTITYLDRIYILVDNARIGDDLQAAVNTEILLWSTY